MARVRRCGPREIADEDAKPPAWASMSRSPSSDTIEEAWRRGCVLFFNSPSVFEFSAPRSFADAQHLIRGLVDTQVHQYTTDVAKVFSRRCWGWGTLSLSQHRERRHQESECESDAETRETCLQGHSSFANESFTERRTVAEQRTARTPISATLQATPLAGSGACFPAIEGARRMPRAALRASARGRDANRLSGNE